MAVGSWTESSEGIVVLPKVCSRVLKQGKQACMMVPVDENFCGMFHMSSMALNYTTANRDQAGASGAPATQLFRADLALPPAAAAVVTAGLTHLRAETTGRDVGGLLRSTRSGSAFRLGPPRGGGKHGGRNSKWRAEDAWDRESLCAEEVEPGKLMCRGSRATGCPVVCLVRAAAAH